MAQRHPTSRKRQPNKKEDPDDVFVAKVFEISTWARENTQALILFGIALVVVVAGAIYYVDFRSTLEQQAIEQLEAIQQTVALGDPEAATVELSQYLDRFSDTPYAEEARLLLATLYLRRDRPESAVQTLEESDLTVAEPMGVQVHTLLGKAYEQTGNLEAAEETFLRVAQDARMEFQRIAALEHAARVRSARADHAGAAELYERILENFEASDEERGLYELRLAEARTAAANG